MELHYCEKCRRQITQAELEMGKALMLGEETYCAQCKDAVLAEMAAGAAPPAAAPTHPTKITRMIRTGARPGVARPPTATGLRPAGGGSGGAMAPAASSRNTTIIVAVAAGVFGLVIGYLLLSSGGEAEPERWGTPPPAPPKVAAPPSSRGPGSGGARVVRSGAVGVPDDAKDANDFEPVAAPEAPSEADGVARLITAENAYEIQTAIGPKGWKILRSEEAKRFGKRGIRLTPIAEEEPRPSSDNALAIRLGRSADLSGYGKLGFWLGGRNVEKNLAEVSIVVGTEEVPLTGGKPIEYDTRWRFFSFDLAGKRDDVRGIVVRFNASVPAKPANFEVWLDDVVAYGRPGSGTAGPAVPVAPPAPPETGG